MMLAVDIDLPFTLPSPIILQWVSSWLMQYVDSKRKQQCKALVNLVKGHTTHQLSIKEAESLTVQACVSRSISPLGNLTRLWTVWLNNPFDWHWIISRFFCFLLLAFMYSFFKSLFFFFFFSFLLFQTIIIF